MKSKCVLSVNVNKIATLRNSRGGDVPNIISCVKDLIRFGAEGITVHPRPDKRHIRKVDVMNIHQLLKKINQKRPHAKKIEFNIEGYPSRDFLKLIDKIRPDQVTLVPDPPEALTSNAGWKIHKNERLLRQVLKRIAKTGARVSLFIDVFSFSQKDFAALARLRPERIELYTEKFAADFLTSKRKSTLKRYAHVARQIQNLDIAINAGHDLDLKNVRALLKAVPEIIECSIGHALISEALYLGFQKTIQSYLKQMRR